MSVHGPHGRDSLPPRGGCFHKALISCYLIQHPGATPYKLTALNQAADPVWMCDCLPIFNNEITFG